MYTELRSGDYPRLSQLLSLSVSLFSLYFSPPSLPLSLYCRATCSFARAVTPAWTTETNRNDKRKNIMCCCVGLTFTVSWDCFLITNLFGKDEGRTTWRKKSWEAERLGRSSVPRAPEGRFREHILKWLNCYYFTAISESIQDANLFFLDRVFAL